jgi:hypothetical protein
VVLNILSMCVLDFCVMSVVCSEFMALFIVFNLWIGPDFVFGSCS